MTSREIERCVRKWQARLGLEAWEIEIVFDESAAEEAALAEVRRTPDYLSARILFAFNWRHWSADAISLNHDESATPKSIDRLISHELLHLVMHDLQVVEDGISDNLHRDVWDLFLHQRDHTLERAIEELSRAFCRAYGED